MTDNEKCNAYELHLIDMIQTIQERMDELKEARKNGSLDIFDKGREEAYFEILDIIKTRHSIIWDVIVDRILVIGCPGSRKSTFSTRLGEHYDIPVTHLDRLYWNGDGSHISR